jgi:ADP-ribose pyrophosphatase YjhB (NUDIX family)
MNLPFHYCPYCGTAGPDIQNDKHVQCGTCGFQYFHNSAATVAAIIECQNQVLLVRRAFEPQQGFLDLPGGFVGADESLDEALRRELGEELDIDVSRSTLTYLGSFNNRYPFSGVTYSLCDIYFTLQVASKEGMSANDDVSALEWWNKESLPWEEIAFPSIKKAIKLFLSKGQQLYPAES